MVRQMMLAACALACAANADAHEVGPFKMGMTLAEARAAAPALDWREQRSTRSSRIVALEADKALTIGAFTFDLSIRPGYYGAYTIQLNGAAPVKNRAGCRKNAIALVAELEKRYGAFAAANTPLPPQRLSAPRAQVNRTPDGAPYVTMTPGYPTGPARKELKAGAASTLEAIEGRAEPSDMSWAARREPNGASTDRITLGGVFQKKAGEPVCAVELAFERDGAPPPRETVDAAKLVLQTPPSPAAMHYSIEGLKLPAGGVTASTTCRVSRASGSVGLCENVTPAAMASAVQQRANATRFDVASLDPDNPAPLYAAMTFTLSPADRLKNPPPKEIPTIYASARPPSTFSRLPTADELHRYYPPAALRREIEATVRVRCTVNDDLSLACADATVESQYQMDDAVRGQFKQAGLQISRLVRVTANGRDGKPMAGKSVVLPVDFRMPN